MKAKKIIVLTVCMLLMVMQVNAEETLTITAIENLSHGFITEKILKEAYKRIGIRMEVKGYPAERAMQMANDGESDGELRRPAGMDKEYKNLIMVPQSVDFGEAVVFTKNKVFSINGWDSLKPYKIGILRGNKFAEKGTEGMNRFAANTIEQLFEMLDAGRTDIIVLLRRNGLATLKKLNLTGIRALEPPVENMPLYHYLNKKNERLVPKITAALQEMEKEGLIQKIKDQAMSDFPK